MLWIKTVIDPKRGGRFAQAEMGAGDHLLDVLRAAAALATRIECGIEFEFNDRLAWILPGMDPEEQYHWLTDFWERDPGSRPPQA